MTSAPHNRLPMGAYPTPGRHRPKMVVPPVSQQPMAVLGVLSDYLIRTASVLGILAVLGVASVVGEQQPSTAAAANAPAHQATSR